MDDATLSRELALAFSSAIAARQRLDGMMDGAVGYEAAVISYLQATVLHLAIASLIQTREQAALREDVEALRVRVAFLRHAVN